MQICRNIESLMPNAQPSLDHVLLSLILHRKTGSREVLQLVYEFGCGISYNETLFFEDKWAEWDKNQHSSIPSNVSKMVPTTVVADNIDWKNKTIGGKETHNTNYFVIQHTALSNVSGAKVNLEPDYNFDRKRHKSFKGEASVLPKYYFQKVNCDKAKQT